MDRSDSIVKLAEALCEVQKTELFALTDKKNPFFKSKYADLSSVWDAIRVPLTSNGLSITQTTTNGNTDGVTIETILIHVSGEYISGSLYIKPEKNTPQGLGSAITYGRRYALMGIVGIAPEDDDGERAMARKKKDREVASKATIHDSDVPGSVIGGTEVDIDTEKVWRAFISQKALTDKEVQELEDYITESAKSIGMDAQELKDNAIKAGDLEDMLEAVINRVGSEQKKDANGGNWWDQSKHWSFRSKGDLMDLVMSGFGDREITDVRVCKDNPDAHNMLKAALPETKKALVRKYDKMFGAGAFNKLIKK